MLQVPPQILTFEQLLYDEGADVGLFADILHVDDVRMAHDIGGARFTEKPADELAVVHVLRKEQFDGNLPTYEQVLRSVDFTHSPFAQLLDELVLAEKDSAL